MLDTFYKDIERFALQKLNEYKINIRTFYNVKKEKIMILARTMNLRIVKRSDTMCEMQKFYGFSFVNFWFLQFWYFYLTINFHKFFNVNF